MMASNDSGDHLTIYYQNVRGLRTKTSEFYRQVCLNSYPIIILTETWLLDGVLSSELFDERYVIWRRDRDLGLTRQSRGGGILIATQRDLPVTLQPLFNSTAEDLWLCVRLKQANSRAFVNVFICVLYLCKQNNGLSFNAQLINFLSKLNEVVLNHPSDSFLIVGDFNMSGIVWVPSDNLNIHCNITSSLCPTGITSVDETLLSDELKVLGLGQFNGILNQFGKILDLVLSDQVITVTKCLDPLVHCDAYHPALLLTANFFCPILDYAPRTVYLYNKADFGLINNDISSTDWTYEFSSRSVDEAVNFFNQSIWKLHTKYVPVKVLSNKTFPVWYNSSLKRAIKEKYKYLRKFKIYGNKCDEMSFTYLRERVKTLESTCYRHYLQSTEEAIKNNPKCFWSYVKNKTKSHSMPSSMEFNNENLSSGESICSAFSSYFQSTFLSTSHTSNHSSTFQTSSFPTFSRPDVVSDITKIFVEENEIKILLSKLDKAKTAGPDNISAKFLVPCSSSIAFPIALLFRKSLSTCTVPQIWKSAFITPVHKKGTKTQITNYRPISKLCIIAKIFERLVYNQVYSALKYSLSTFQHGFLKGRSTVSNLILLNDFITEAMDNRHQVDVVYTDYSKAFDRIDHSILLHKLNWSGIRGDLLRWFSSYIDNRSQAVALNNYISSWVSVPSGVPQGSLIGPLLFIFYINDIDMCLLSSKLLCFADDMKIFKTITCRQDMIALQADLSRLEDYCRVNRLDLNPSKCTAITFTRNHLAIPTNYTLQGQNLPISASIHDLGVRHDSKLLFDTHINDIVNKASKSLGFIMRLSKSFTKAKTIKILYCTYVRSHLEYASQIWNPCYHIYIDRIEAIQKRFIKYLCFRFKVPYYSSNYLDLCKKFHLLPLNKRRDIADYLYLLKLIHNNIDCSELLSKIFFNIPQKSPRFNPPFRVPRASTKYRQNTYIVRASRTFNKLTKLHNIDPFLSSVPTARRTLSAPFFGMQ